MSERSVQAIRAMTLRTVLVNALLAITVVLRAQGLDTVPYPGIRSELESYGLSAAARHFLRVEGTGIYDSNALRNDLVSGLWNGGTLDRETRQRSEGRSDRSNRAGYQLEASITYAWGDTLFGNGHMRPRLSVAYHDVMGLRYANDLYHLTFFGNADFENANAHLGGSAIEQVQYQTFGFGFEDKGTRSYLLFQLVNGRSLNSARVDKADLFTATDGRYLQLDLEGSYARTDTAAPAALSNGVGAALSSEVNARFRFFGRPALFTIGVQDLGVIVWSSQSLRVPKDSVLVYEGIRVDDVLDLDGALVGNSLSQDTLGFSYRRGSFLRPLPTLAYMRVTVAAAHNMRYGAELNLRNLPGYIPHGQLFASHVFAERNVLRLETSFGGFGGWRAGVGYERAICKGLVLSLRTANAIGWLSGHARGRSLAVAIQMAW
jgi:hypothetical protein